MMEAPIKSTFEGDGGERSNGGSMAEISSEVSAARVATEWLGATLPALTPEDWQTPNACGIWSVADVGAHLVWVTDLYADAVRRALADDVGPPKDLVVPESPAVMHARMAEIAFMYRQNLGDGVGGALTSRAPVLVALFERLAPTDWDRPAYHPAMVRPVRRRLVQYVSEVCVHGWDMLHQTGREVMWPEECHDTIVDLLAGPLQNRFVPRAPLAQPEQYHVRLSPTVPEGVSLTVFGDRFEFDRQSDETGADAVLTIHPQTFILLAQGRLNWRQALQAGDVVVTARRDGADRLPAWFGLN
jgi:uncharacterized protein (TIGR03083 family)